MRKLLVGLIVVGLLAVAAPSMAQTADPLGLIASGAVIPYVGTTGLVSGIRTVVSATGAFGAATESGSLAILEVSSPVKDNSDFHMFFFDQSCTRVGPSVPNSLTANDADLLNLNLIPNIPNAGLIAAAAADLSGGVGGTLVPLVNQVHARVYWINTVTGALSRVLEPISALNAETSSSSWNPLRTAATFVAPLEGSTVRTTLYLSCPTQNIIPGVFPDGAAAPFSTTLATATTTISPASSTIPVLVNGAVPFALSGTAFINGTDAFTYTGTTTSSFTGVSGIDAVYTGLGVIITPTPAGGGFPVLDPKPVPGSGGTPLFLRIYDDDENFLRDVHIFCRCWGAHTLADIDPVFSDPVLAPHGTYTEAEGEGACLPQGVNSRQTKNCSFTGYRSIRFGAGTVGNDVFGRLSNGNFNNIREKDSPISIPFELGNR